MNRSWESICVKVNVVTGATVRAGDVDFGVVTREERGVVDVDVVTEVVILYRTSTWRLTFSWGDIRHVGEVLVNNTM